MGKNSQTNANNLANPSKLAPEAYDFAPDLLTIQESPPSRLPRWVLLGVVGLMLLLIIWAFVARLDVIVTAQGRLVPISFTKVVQPAEAGVVTEILVKDGDVVKAGQVLLRLDARASNSEMAALGHDVAIKRLSLRRIEAELQNRPFAGLPTDPVLLVAQVEAQFRARRLSYQDALAQEQVAKQRASSELEGAQQTLVKLREVLPITRAAAEKHEQLEKEGFISQLASADKRREYIEKSQDLQSQIQAVNALKSAIDQIHKKISSIESSYKSQLENERIEVLTQLNKSGQELDKSTIKSGLLEIKSPNEGVVKDLAVANRGAVVQAGTLLMNIVPRDEPMQAEVLLGNEDVGFIAIGQAAQVKVAAYPFQKYGLMQGLVTHLSADAADPKQQQNPNLPQLTYRALVKLETQSLISPSGNTLSLTPGMLVVAEIAQGQRSVIEYLLSPVQKVGAEAARER